LFLLPGMLLPALEEEPLGVPAALRGPCAVQASPQQSGGLEGKLTGH
jgi:hypothetical protein